MCVDHIKCVIGWLLPIKLLLIRPTLDVMHIKKNVCKSVIKFIIGVKDTFKVRRHMEVCGVREHLWLNRNPHNPRKIFQPIASCVLKLEEFKTSTGRLGALKVPSDYCSVVGKFVMDNKLKNMKSHDWHVLMQHFMPFVYFLLQAK